MKLIFGFQSSSRFRIESKFECFRHYTNKKFELDIVTKDSWKWALCTPTS